MNNTNIKAAWAQIKSEEDRVNELIAEYLDYLNEGLIWDAAERMYGREIERLVSHNNTDPWYIATERAAEECQSKVEDYIEDARELFPEIKPNSPEFRHSLFNLIIKQRLDEKTKKEIDELIIETLKKVREMGSMDRNDISQGKLATSLTLKVQKVLIDSGYKGEIDDSLREHIKNTLYEYRSHAAKGEIPIDEQQKLSRDGLTNEIEDICVSNILARKDLVEIIAKMLYTEIQDIRVTETSSGDNYNYDRHTKATGLFYHDDNSVSIKKLDMYFDSKSNLSSLGSRQDDFIISSQDVITHIIANGEFDNNLRRYNRRSSIDNELLLEYLIQQYGQRPIYYIIDKKKEEVYPLSYLVDSNQLKMDPKGLSLVLNDLTKGIYKITYAKAVTKK